MEEIVESCKAKNLQIDEILLFYYMLGRQMAAEYENHPQNRVAFGMLPANKGQRASLTAGVICVGEVAVGEFTWMSQEVSKRLVSGL